jgi:D-alanyl-D-alanine carboxypeptidase
MKLHVLVAIGLAIGLIVATFAQQKEPSLSEQDRSQTITEREGTTRGSSALKPIDQAALQAAVDGAAEEMLVPGAVVILSTPQGEFTVSYGTTTLGATIPPRADTHFRIASNTKTMTAAVIVQLAQEGRLDLDDPVSKYVSSVPDGDQITIADLLKMRSGLYNYTDRPSSRQSSTETQPRSGPRTKC